MQHHPEENLERGYLRDGWTAAALSQWKPLDLVFNSSAAKCADRLTEQKSPMQALRTGEKGDGCWLHSVVPPSSRGRNSYAR